MPVTQIQPNGFRAIRVDEGAIFVEGQGASPAGNRPFLDRLDLATLKAERLFRSDKAALEYFLAFTGHGYPVVPDLAPDRPIDPPNAVRAHARRRQSTRAAGEAQLRLEHDRHDTSRRSDAGRCARSRSAW